jgi:hypothetical protein
VTIQRMRLVLSPVIMRGAIVVSLLVFMCITALHLGRG